MHTARVTGDRVHTMHFIPSIQKPFAKMGYALKAGQLTYDCRYSTMHGIPVTGGRGFRGLKPLWYKASQEQ